MIYTGLLSLLLAEYSASQKCSAVLLCSADSIYPGLMVQRRDVGVLGLAAAIGWSKILRPTRHKIDHFGDVLPSQSRY